MEDLIGYDTIVNSPSLHFLNDILDIFQNQFVKVQMTDLASYSDRN